MKIKPQDNSVLTNVNLEETEIMAKPAKQYDERNGEQ